jgi:transposase-like protein
MEAKMKTFTAEERVSHVRAWKESGLGKAKYAAGAGIRPMTFYNWVREPGTRGAGGFVEIRNRPVLNGSEELVIEKGGIKIHLPLTAGINELGKVLRTLGEKDDA